MSDINTPVASITPVAPDEPITHVAPEKIEEEEAKLNASINPDESVETLTGGRKSRKSRKCKKGGRKSRKTRKSRKSRKGGRKTRKSKK